jgi:GNAT superfamily N-acetyltransferase
VIFNLYTEPEYRRKGHARNHLQFVINLIRRAGFEGAIEIEVEPFEEGIDSEKLRLFYKKMGLDILASTKTPNKKGE